MVGFNHKNIHRRLHGHEVRVLQFLAGRVMARGRGYSRGRRRREIATITEQEESTRRPSCETYWRVTVKEELTDHTASFLKSVFQVMRLLLCENTGLTYLLTSSLLR